MYSEKLSQDDKRDTGTNKKMGIHHQILLI